MTGLPSGVLWGRWLSPPKRFLTKGLLWRAFPTSANTLLSTGGSNTSVTFELGAISVDFNAGPRGNPLKTLFLGLRKKQCGENS